MRFKYTFFSLIGLLTLFTCAFSLPANTLFERNTGNSYHSRKTTQTPSENNDTTLNITPKTLEETSFQEDQNNQTTQSNKVVVAKYVQYDQETGRERSVYVVTSKDILNATCLQDDPITKQKVRLPCKPESIVTYSVPAE